MERGARQCEATSSVSGASAGTVASTVLLEYGVRMRCVRSVDSYTHWVCFVLLSWFASSS